MRVSSVYAEGRRLQTVCHRADVKRGVPDRWRQRRESAHRRRTSPAARSTFFAFASPPACRGRLRRANSARRPRRTADRSPLGLAGRRRGAGDRLGAGCVAAQHPMAAAEPKVAWTGHGKRRNLRRLLLSWIGSPPFDRIASGSVASKPSVVRSMPTPSKSPTSTASILRDPSGPLGERVVGQAISPLLGCGSGAQTRWRGLRNAQFLLGQKPAMGGDDAALAVGQDQVC